MMYSMIPFGRYHGGLDTIFDDLERSFFPPANRQPTAFRTDIRDEGDHFLLEAELPGFQKEDIHLESKTAAVSLRNITKSFGSVVANDKVNLDIYRGEILALLGENGSGKTTLMNMLSGIYFPDEGQIFINGKETVIRSPKDAYACGIGMVHQHFKLIDVLSAAENVALGMKGHLNLKKTSEKIRSICDKYGFDVDPDQKVYNMSVSQKQTVEIIKVLYRGADILILDEPTAVLTPQETEKLFAVLRNMRNDGKAIIIITHKMHEVESLSDRVAVLRRGCFVGDMATKETNAQEMTDMMVGHKVTLNIARPEPVNPKPRLKVEGLSVKDEDGIFRLKNVSFEARSGEILGIAGISGCGQKELLELKACIGEMGFHIRSIEFSQKEKGIVKASIILGVPKQKNIAELLELKQPWITGLEVKGKLLL